MMFTLLNNYARPLKNKSSVLFFLLFPVLLFSQKKEDSNSAQYIVNHRFFSVENSGLASRYISDATLDSRGFMWFATFGGISRFDGKTFVSITK